MSSTNATPIATSAAYGATRPVAVSELKRAWSAVQAGEFRRARAREVEPTPLRQVDEHHGVEARHDRHAGDQAGDQGSPMSTPQPAERLFETAADRRWAPAPGERVLPVLGAAGSVGCSTVALALATAAGGIDAPRVSGGRVVECCSAPASGLAAASTAELGQHESGWVQGTRGGVLLERASRVLVSAGQVPAPAPIHDQTSSTVDAHIDRPSDRAGSLTVFDTGWEVGHLLAGDGWLAGLVRRAPVVVVVARPTIPGFRRLEAALELLEADHGVATLIAVLGGRRKRWAKGVEHSAGARTRSALREDRVHEIPEHRNLAVAGLSSTPLPPGLVAAAEQLLSATRTTPPAPLTRGHVPELFAGASHDVEDLHYRATTPDRTSPQPGGSESPTSTAPPHLDADTQLGTGTNPEGTAR